MKALFTTALLAILMATATTVQAQDWREDYLGLPGDNLNLYATMKLFQESETLEGFERDLNSEDMGINNLDLNGDRLVDYINVTDYVDGRVHNIVLSVALNKKHRQDVAVFIIERFRNGSVQIQLVGDEALYGRNYIIEPYYDNNYAGTANPGYYGRPSGNVQVTVITTSAWEIANWPVVRYMYYPGYLAWRSPWYWGYWPTYYHAWNPWYWHYYHGYHSHWYNDYYAHYRPWNHIRYHGYHDYYYTSVRHWSKDVHKNIKKGYYKETYSRPELQNQGRALHARVATESNRTRVNGGTREASAPRLSNAVPESARVRSTSTAAARRPDSSVNTRTANTTGTLRSGTVGGRQETETVRTRREAGTTGTRNEAVEPSRNSTPVNSGTYTRPASTRSTGTREASPAVNGENRSRQSEGTAPEVTGKSATRPATRSEATPVREGTRSTETYSAPRTRTETAPRTTTTVRQESSSGSSSGRVSNRTSAPASSGNTKVATRPSESRSNNSGSVSRSSSREKSSSTVERSSSGSSSRSSGSSREESSGSRRR
jgi:hypothetical protein